MQYSIPFTFHGKAQQITVEYSPMENSLSSGFRVLPLPFDPEKCKGYPMLHAYFEQSDLQGYERYCGWIQFIRRTEYADIHDVLPAHIRHELDVPEHFRKRNIPYFAMGYPAELFDAPCRNLHSCEKLIWQACIYLVDIPSIINGYRLGYLAGFSWGYTEDVLGQVSLLNFGLLTEKDWNTHCALVPFEP